MKICLTYVLLLVVSLCAAGCAATNVAHERQSSMISAAYQAVDALVKGQASTPVATPNGSARVLVATVVDLNNLNRSTPFGRLLAEQMSSRLAQLGIPVSELKLAGKLFVSKSEGELVLSREVKEISSSQKADLVLVGTYVDAGTSVFVTVKLVRAADNEVSNAYNFAMNKSTFVSTLLGKNTY